MRESAPAPTSDRSACSFAGLNLRTNGVERLDGAFARRSMARPGKSGLRNGRCRSSQERRSDALLRRDPGLGERTSDPTRLRFQRGVGQRAAIVAMAMRSPQSSAKCRSARSAAAGSLRTTADSRADGGDHAHHHDDGPWCGSHWARAGFAGGEGHDGADAVGRSTGHDRCDDRNADSAERDAHDPGWSQPRENRFSRRVSWARPERRFPDGRFVLSWAA
jgi:hypothetical protein